LAYGLLIALEGVDGAGTTTQAERLGRRLGDRALVTREPSMGPVGRLLRQLLGGVDAPCDSAALALLFAADRRDHLAREIEPALARGQHVVTDRYVLSSLAYQSLSVDRAWVAELNTGVRAADLTLFLDVQPEVAEARRRARGGPAELFDAPALQERIGAAYRREAARLAAEGARVVTLDGGAAPDEVEQAIAREVEICLSASG
jgi:dTMP kinase